MPETRLRAYREPMPETNVLDRFESWLRSTLTLDGFRRHRLVVEAVIAGLYFVLFMGAVANYGFTLGLIALALLAVSIVLYRIRPVIALSVAAIGTLGMLGSGYPYYTGFFPVFLPLLFVFFGAAAYGRPVTRWLALAGTIFAAVGILSTVSYYSNNVGGLGTVLFFLFIEALLALAWVGGMLVYVNRSRRAAQSGEIVATVKLGEAKQVATLEQERNRVARDVHDIVAHSLAVVIAQADGARYGSKNVPAPVVEALENIASTARGALTDVRVLLGELRHNQEQGPQPGMNDLDALVRGFRDSGLEVEWNSYGKAVELTDAPALAVYRIVQEGLTNALRHGDRGQPVELVFDWGSASLAVIVTNGIPRGTTIPGNAAGHGIPGMRERATLAGGELEASDGTNGRFRVRVTIPFTREPVAA
jgi:signal transduction histidine kinase